MAGLPSRTKKKQSPRSTRPANREGESLPRIDIENSNDLEASPTVQTGLNNASLDRDRSSERNSSAQREPSAQPIRSPNSPPDLLWITTDKPADFKDAKIQRMISRHVMRDYQQKDQSKKESGRTTRHKNPTKSPSDDDASVTSSTSQISLTPMADLGRDFGTGNPSANSLSPSAVQQSSAFTQNMFYPLRIDLSSVEFKQRLGHLISRYLSVWYGEQTSKFCRGRDRNIWQHWMPLILENEALLYSQAFAAVSHINFLNPEAYKSERWALKGQAIQKINETLNDVNATEHDQNVAAVLAMAFVAHLESLGAANYSTHMLGLQRMVAVRGGLVALRSDQMLYHNICLCDLLGTIIYRTPLAILSAEESHVHADSPFQANLDNDLLDSPLQSSTVFSGQRGFSELRPDIVQILNDMHDLTQMFEETYTETTLADSIYMDRCASIERSLDSLPFATDTHSKDDQIYEACRLAALIYFRALVHNVSFGSPINTQIMQNLRFSLASSILCGWNDVPGVLIWTLLVGTAADRSGTDDVFFAGHLSTTSRCLLPLLHNVPKVLKKFLWIESVVDERRANIPM